MTSEREGAAIRQDHRSNSYAARRRMPRESISGWESDEDWSIGKTIAIATIGAVFVYILMFLAAAY